MKRLLRLFAVGIALTSSSAFADDFTTAGGLWTNPGTWAGGVGIPDDASDNVTMSGSVQLDTSVTIGDFSASTDGSVLSNSGSVRELTITGTATIAQQLDFRFSQGSTITSTGVFNFGGHRDTNATVLSATLNFGGETNFTLDPAQSGGGAGANAIRANRDWTNTGTFKRNGGGDLTVAFIDGSSFVNQSTFEKSDADTLSITTGSFQNSGNINVLNGTLAIANYQHSSGNISVSSGATFQANVNVGEGGLEGSGVVTGNVTLGGGGLATTLDAGSSSSVGELNISGNLSMDSDTTLTINLGDGVTYDVIDVGGSVDVNGAALKIVLDGGAYTVGQEFTFLTAAGGDAAPAFGSITFENNHPDFAGTLSVSDNDYKFTITAVPEPSSLAVLGLVSVGAIARRRRRA